MSGIKLRRWKTKERKFNQKYKLHIVKKPSREPDFSHKFLFLISKYNLCTIVKFISRYVCVTIAVIAIDDFFASQVAPKYLLSRRKYKKFLAQSEVRITKRYEECFLKMFKTEPQNKAENGDKKVTPIKIVSCKICKLRVIQTDLEEHIASHDSEGKGYQPDNGVPKPYKCNQCFESFFTENFMVGFLNFFHLSFSSF